MTCKYIISSHTMINLREAKPPKKILAVWSCRKRFNSVAAGHGAGVLPIAL